MDVCKHRVSNAARGVLAQGFAGALLRFVEDARVIGAAEENLEHLGESVLASGCRELGIKHQSPLHHPPPLHQIIPGTASAKQEPSLVVFVRLTVAGRTIAVAEPGSAGGFCRFVPLLKTPSPSSSALRQAGTR